MPSPRSQRILGRGFVHTRVLIITSPKVAISRVTILGVICEQRALVPYHYGSLSTTFDRPVYEYPLNGQWIMLDMDDGYVLWTGIWKGQLSRNLQ